MYKAMKVVDVPTSWTEVKPDFDISYMSIATTQELELQFRVNNTWKDVVTIFANSGFDDSVHCNAFRFRSATATLATISYYVR